MKSYKYKSIITASLVAGSVFAADKPNIIIYLADDLGLGCINAYGASEELISTPNLNRFAEEGIRFNNAHTTSAVSSPTRYSLLTGRYNWRSRQKKGVVNPGETAIIENSRPTIQKMLQEQGYATAIIGKWHLGFGTNQDPSPGFNGSLKPGPLETGFDYYFGLPHNHGDIAGVYVENYEIYGKRTNQLFDYGLNYYGKPYTGFDAPQRIDNEVLDVLTNKAINWLDENEKNEKPFFLYFAAQTPHEPITPSKRMSGKSKAGAYGDFVQDLDYSFGQILKWLDDNGKAENTIIIFTSDNGAIDGGNVKQMNDYKRKAADGKQLSSAVYAQIAIDAGLQLNGNVRGRKHRIFEGGTRVPYIVRWPGQVPAGVVTDEVVSLVDTYATLATALNMPMPSKELGAEDSQNIVALWKGATINRTQICPVITHSAGGIFAIRSGEWKLIEGKIFDYQDGQKDETAAQLYNLKNDPMEMVNVLEKHPEIAEQLKNELNRIRNTSYTR